MKTLLKTTVFVAAGILLSLNSFAKKDTPTKDVTAQAAIEGRSGSQTAGTVDFKQINDDLKISYNITGLKANSTFGFHIHEKGDCSSADAKSAGSHFHKMAETGGTSKQTPGAFAGDLPAIKSDAQGVASGSVTTNKVSLNKVNAVDGLSIMIHGGPDDVKESSPPRIGCGVIKMTK